MLDKPYELYLSSFKVLSRFVVGETVKYCSPCPYLIILPLRVAVGVGLALSVAAGVIAVVALIERLRHPDLPRGWASLMVAMLLLVGV